MGWVESLQKAIDYMEDHLLDDITIEERFRGLLSGKPSRSQGYLFLGFSKIFYNIF